MTVNAPRTQTRLTEQVAEEIRALLARRRISGRELARRLDASHSWVNFRLTGAQPINLDDLQRIAEALGVEVADLFPREHRPEATRANGHPMGPSSYRPERTRPNGHPKRTSPHPPTLRPARIATAVSALSGHADDSPAQAEG